MPPDTPTPTTRALARRLLAITQAEASDSPKHAVINITERLRVALTRVAGADSFASLLRRTVVLAKAEVPALSSVKVGADGGLSGVCPVFS